ncbi:hypothetical protein V5P93_000507 [Actinokineospora auranticolor]|uniref:Uncharacterized protein n=1 Tax=Actinokineospora auranticolor TaxID=155976 RepID=A0A2S6GZG6_9PSEU|nr:hypothetical protein [Actinokineospora auranticolor]PPK70613.1 hypothetical protein CLV40_102530 [Actinokineospora auranticolor]
MLTRPQLRCALDPGDTAALLGAAPALYATDTADLLRSALVVAVAAWGPRHGAALSVPGPGGLSDTVGRLAAAPAAGTVGFAFRAPAGQTHAIDVRAEIEDGLVTATWTWCAASFAERAVADLARTWCAALAGLAAEARRVLPLPTDAPRDVEVVIAVPGDTNDRAVRQALAGLASAHPILTTGRRQVGTRAYAAPGAGDATGATAPEWTSLVRFALVRPSSADARLIITGDPAVVGADTVETLADALRRVFGGDAGHVRPSPMNSP